MASNDDDPWLVHQTIQEKSGKLLATLKPMLIKARETLRQREEMYNRARTINQLATEALQDPSESADAPSRKISSTVDLLDELKTMESKVMESVLSPIEPRRRDTKSARPLKRKGPPAKQPRFPKSKGKSSIQKESEDEGEAVVAARTRERPTVGQKPHAKIGDKKEVSGNRNAECYNSDESISIEHEPGEIPVPGGIAVLGEHPVSSDSDDSGSVPSVIMIEAYEENRVIAVPMTYKSRDEYFASLTDDDRKQLDLAAQEMRNDPTKGTDDGRVLTHVNMQDGPNLYIVYHILRGMNSATIQVVEADNYDYWCNSESVRSTADIKEGNWWCTNVRCYYQDIEKAIEDSRWRYETHQILKGGGMSSGYYSFDDRFRRSKLLGEKELLDWSEHLSLLKGGAFVFGPFRWEDENEFSISTEVWTRALPEIVKKKTEDGTLFWQGFKDETLLQAGFNEAHIRDRKRNKSEIPDCPPLPVLYSEIDPSRRAKFIIRVIRSKNERRKICPAIWKEDVGRPGRPNPAEKEGAWMQKEIRSTKSSTKSSAKKKKHTKKHVENI